MTVDIRALIRGVLPLAAVITALCLLIYAAVQQSIRSAANDPQIQLAEDAARALAAGTRPESLRVLFAGGTVDIEESLAPFVIVYDERGTPVSGTGELNGHLPTPPAGVLAFAREHGEERVTWQPTLRARIASVIRHVSSPEGGFVLAGRSLREIEIRESAIRSWCFQGWFATLVTGFVVILLSDLLTSVVKPSSGG